ncbi:DUF6074 family protein [Rhizobium sp. CC-YZS058]|uniref:DUF6074 family protein n=1 Tax=Rhizobium sp. CC-YZS058 TaxID=3042153 RepID=UPI002B05A942|nr:DUF6074 family protein [Rhizobium sp. CC-YZS058]MEA3533251.1 DUF6074 family protein [Rhizobium sp. CC-YZS058]
MTVTPFPASRRHGHALRIALRLKAARTQREAEHIIRQTGQTARKQLTAAGLSEEIISREEKAFLVLVRMACYACGSRWAPEPSTARQEG